MISVQKRKSASGFSLLLSRPESVRSDLPQLYPNKLSNLVQKCPTWHLPTRDSILRKWLKWGFGSNKKPLKAIAFRGSIGYARNET